MPFIPRQYSSTLGIPPELMQESVSKHPNIPIQQRQQALQEKKSGKLKIGLDKLNLRTYEPDFKTIYKSMFGVEPEIESMTKRLIKRGNKQGKNDE